MTCQSILRLLPSGGRIIAGLDFRLKAEATGPYVGM